MQAMNASVRNPVFALGYFGTPLVLATVAFTAWKADERPTTILFGSGRLLYVPGVMVPTSMVNVPLNDTLAAVEAPLAGLLAEQVRRSCSVPWQFRNTSCQRPPSHEPAETPVAAGRYASSRPAPPRGFHDETPPRPLPALPPGRAARNREPRTWPNIRSPPSPGNANRAMPVLSVMMRMAELWGYRAHNSNPCKRTRRYRMKPRERFLSAGEAEDRDVERGAGQQRDGGGRGEVGEEVRLDDESGARLAVLALGRNGDRIASIHSRCPTSRASRCPAISAAVAFSKWLSSGSARFAALAIAA